MGGQDPEKDAPPAAPDSPDDVRQVLDSIRRLVSAETTARTDPGRDTVVMLTPDMRVDVPDRPVHREAILAHGLDALPVRSGAPILDEEALRSVINTIVREELQGELGDRISRNLRKLVRREIVQVLEERGDGGPGSDAS